MESMYSQKARRAVRWKLYLSDLLGGLHAQMQAACSAFPLCLTAPTESTHLRSVFHGKASLCSDTLASFAISSYFKGFITPENQSYGQYLVTHPDSFLYG